MMEKRELYQYILEFRGGHGSRHLQIGTDIEDIMYLLRMESEDDVQLSERKQKTDSWEGAEIHFVDSGFTYNIIRKPLSKTFEVDAGARENT